MAERKWTVNAGSTSLLFNERVVLHLEADRRLNLEHLPKLLDALNKAGLVFKPGLPVPTGVAALPEPSQEELARMCLGKKRMPARLAQAIAEKYGQRAYFCPVCSGWHCTHILPDWKPRK
jgi:hypothetical protein